MKQREVCRVSWCVSTATRNGYCATHHERPVLSSVETCDQWLARISRENAAAKRAAAAAALRKEADALRKEQEAKRAHR
jgi:hypothetical protein